MLSNLKKCCGLRPVVAWKARLAKPEKLSSHQWNADASVYMYAHTPLSRGEPTPLSAPAPRSPISREPQARICQSQGDSVWREAPRCWAEANVDQEIIVVPVHHEGIELVLHRSFC